MNNILSITSKATEQIKKIMSNAPNGMDSVVIGVDKSGCSGYSYKLDFGNSSDFKNYEIINQDGAKVLIDPKATMFLLGSIMDYRQDKLASRFVFDNPNRKLYKNGKMTYADWCDKHDFKYCKLGDGIPEDWLQTNGKRSEIYTRRRSTKG